MNEYHDVLSELRDPTRELRRTAPDVWAAFAQLHGAAVGDGALPAATKELLAFTIAVVKHCDGCIASHAKALARLGVTPAAVAEALGVALLMDGGPASVYAPRAWAAYREFAAESDVRASA